MEYKRIECPSCGAPLTVTEDLDYITCGFCGTSLAVEHSGSDLTLKFTKDIEEGIKKVGEKMDASLRTSNDSTRLELRRLQGQQQLASLENKLFRLNEEIRYLERNKKSWKQKLELRELIEQKKSLNLRIKSLEEEIYKTDLLENSQQERGRPQSTSSGKVNINKIESTRKTQTSNGSGGLFKNLLKPSPFKAGCLSGCLVFMVFGFVTVGIAVWLDNIIFGIPIEGEDAGLFSSVAAILTMFAGTIGFMYKFKPDSKLSLWVKEKISNIFKRKTKKK